MDEAKELAEKLRETRQGLIECDVWGCEVLDQAADELERLAAEVDAWKDVAAACEGVARVDRNEEGFYGDPYEGYYVHPVASPSGVLLVPIPAVLARHMEIEAGVETIAEIVRDEDGDEFIGLHPSGRGGQKEVQGG